MRHFLNTLLPSPTSRNLPHRLFHYPFSTLNRPLLNLRDSLPRAPLRSSSASPSFHAQETFHRPPKSYYPRLSRLSFFLRTCSPLLRQVRVLIPWLFDLHQILFIIFFFIHPLVLCCTPFILDSNSDWNAQTTHDSRAIRYVVSVDLSFAVSYSPLLSAYHIGGVPYYLTTVLGVCFSHRTRLRDLTLSLHYPVGYHHTTSYHANYPISFAPCFVLVVSVRPSPLPLNWCWPSSM